MSPKLNIFAIYTSEDVAVMNEVTKRLKSHGKNANFSICNADPIKSGQLWKPQIESRFREADIFLFFISNTFMYSEFVRQLEFKLIIDQLKEGDTNVIPILIDNCPWEIDFEADEYTFSFKQLTVLPEPRKPLKSWHSQEDAYVKIIEGIESQVPNLFNPDVVSTSKPKEQAELGGKREDKSTNVEAEAHNDHQVNEENNQALEPKEESTETKRKYFKVVTIVSIITIIIWAFSFFNKGTEEKPLGDPDIISEESNDSEISQKVEAEKAAQSPVITQLKIGDFHEGGMIFAIDSDFKGGMIVHLEDMGPMTWENAIKIHEQLGEGWRLPTIDELLTLHKTVGQGGENQAEFSDGLYWSATDYDQYQARLLRFRDANRTYRYNKVAPHRKYRVRAIRNFGQ